MRRMLLGISIALFTFVAAADPWPPAGGPFSGSAIDAKTYLVGKTVDFSVARPLPYRYPYWMAFENVKVGNERMLMLMGWKGVKLEPVELVRHKTVKVLVVASGAIDINGLDDDWVAIAPAVTDPAGDDYGALAGEPGTDLASVTLARDDVYLYGRVGTHDGGPRDRTMYIVELQQYLLQMHTPGDVLVNCSKPTDWGWECLVHDRTGAMREHYLPNSSTVKAGVGFIEWKIPISDLENRPSTPSAMFSVAGKQDRGIENRFIRSYIHPSDGSVTDELTQFSRPLIIDFWD
jgi:hypothetical protein